MRSNGWNDNAIRSQIKTWHPDWTEARILNAMLAATPVRTTYKPGSAGYEEVTRGGRGDALDAARRPSDE